MSGKHPRPPARTAQSGPVQTTRPSASTPTHLLAFTHHEGPLPTPNVLAGYEAVQPGLAARIVGWVDDEAAHRRARQNRRDSREHVKELLGMLLGFALAASLVGGGLYLLHEGKQVEGLGTIGTAAVALAVAYFARRKKA